MLIFINMSDKSTTAEFIENASRIHNNKFDYSKVEYVHSKKKVIIICPTHGEFLQIPNSHLRGIGCSRCSGKCKSNTEEFIKKAAMVHGNKYNYSKVKYKQAIKYIKIICPIHGEFLQTPNSHLNGSGCIHCGFINTAASRRKTLEQFIRESRLVHGNRYNYDKSVYIGNHSKLEIVCKLHGSFWQTPHTHLYRDKSGCPKCKLSKGEQKIIAYLDANQVKYVTQKSFDDCRNPKTNYKLKFDFYIPEKNFLIEYDGKQHYMFGNKMGNYITTKKDMDDTQYRDVIKTNYASNHNIPLLRIKYTELNDIDNILSKII